VQRGELYRQQIWRNRWPIFGAVGAAFLLAVFCCRPSVAQQPAPPPAVGVITVKRQPITQSTEYVGRIQATNRVNVVARVAAYLDERLFTEGTEVKTDDLLYRLEQGPFKADVQAKEAAVAQFKAQLQNADIVLTRAQALLRTPAGLQSNIDTATANQKALEAQVLAAEAQLDQSRINLNYTEIRAPIDGKIGRTAVTIGNYVTPNSGVLVSIVSQDPMYVVFPVSTRDVIALRARGAEKSGAIVIRIRLPDGRIYDQVGHLNFIDNTVANNTDTMILRGALPNPILRHTEDVVRELVDGELVTVILEDAEPIEALTIPRAAVLTDQAGDYVYAVGPDAKAQQRRVQLGQSSPANATVISGLSEGETVIAEGIQRVRPGQMVSPGPISSQAAPSVPAAPDENAGGGRGTPPRG
jgi:membrane fusion protein, multidrug efflux system